MINFENILLIDGAMGTSIQNLNLSSSDFGGDHLDGCNEYLNIINPTYIKDIHRSFIDVGANIIETNTFGATPIVLDEYKLSDLAEEINFKAAKIAKSSINDSDNSILVAGSMGPTTKLLSLNQIKSSDITFDLLVDNYRIQARGLISGGSDFLLIETSQDILNVKAAIKGISLAKSDLNRNDIPFAVQCTIENMGTTLGGQDIESFYLTIKHNDLLWIGMNCATGPKFMREHLRILSQISSHPISIVPNAGLPDEHGNYNESPSGISVVNIQEDEEMVTATFRNIPNLAVESTQFVEQNGDMDNVPNPGETHGITIDFYNPSSNMIYDLEMVIVTADPNIILLNNESILKKSLLCKKPSIPESIST